MVLQLLEPRKAINKAFLKIKANREPLECFKVNLIQILNSINEDESGRFSKIHTRDFIKKSSYDFNNSLNYQGRFFSVTSIAETLIGKKIEVKTPNRICSSIFHKQTKGLKFLYAIRFDSLDNNIFLDFLKPQKSTSCFNFFKARPNEC